MNSAFIIVGGELDEDPTQVGLPEHDQVVDALPPDGVDQPFRKAVLPWRAGRDRLVANAHGAQAAGDNRTRRKPARCQRTSVPGRMIVIVFRINGNHR